MEPELKSRLSPLTDQRAYRLRVGVTLLAASFYARLSLARASTLERFPGLAKPGELERLRAGVDRAVRELAAARLPAEPNGQSR
jgi:hypothetical protein